MTDLLAAGIIVAVLAIAGCTQNTAGPPPTTVAPTNSHTAAPVSPTATWAPPQTVELQPGPHSKLADVDLPVGTVPLPNNATDSETWRYNVSYDDLVAFLRKQFATGQKYDSRGAPWWRNLPPCYRSRYDYNANKPYEESPPKGWDTGDSTTWQWEDSSMQLQVQAFDPSGTIAPNEILIYYMPADPLDTCNRH